MVRMVFVARAAPDFFKDFDVLAPKNAKFCSPAGALSLAHVGQPKSWCLCSLSLGKNLGSGSAL